MIKVQLKWICMQRGRTILEMISVLCIIGVLSIGAISSYRISIDKHQANIIFNDLKTIIVSVFLPNFELINDFDEFEEQLDIETEYKAHYSIFKEDENTYIISLTPVSKGVCNLLIKESPEYLEAIIPNKLTSGVCENMNELDFYILAEFTSGDDDRQLDICDKDNPCSGCSVCIMNRCIDKDQKCSNGKECYKSACICPEGKFLNGGATAPGSQYCSSCSSGTQVYATQTECHKCDNQFFVSSMGGCYGCDNDYYAQLSDRKTTLANCDRCPQRYFDTLTNVCRKCPAGQMKNAEGTGCE